MVNNNNCPICFDKINTGRNTHYVAKCCSTNNSVKKFCRNCVSRMRQNHRVKCPICRKSGFPSQTTTLINHRPKTNTMTQRLRKNRINSKKKPRSQTATRPHRPTRPNRRPGGEAPRREVSSRPSIRQPEPSLNNLAAMFSRINRPNRRPSIRPPASRRQQMNNLANMFARI